MKWSISSLALILLMIGAGGCARLEESVAVEKAGAVGTPFNRTGTVTLHRGEPCASQIMFDFHRPGIPGVIWLSAPMRQTKTLTELADCGCMVQVSGIWRTGGTRGCRYVSVTSAEERKW